MTYLFIFKAIDDDTFQTSHEYHIIDTNEDLEHIKNTLITEFIEASQHVEFIEVSVIEVKSLNIYTPYRKIEKKITWKKWDSRLKPDISNN